MANLSPVPQTNSIDLTTWNYPIPPNWSVVNEMLERAFVETPPTADFPFSWAGADSDGRKNKAPNDPLTIYISIPLGPTLDDHCEWGFSVREALDDLLGLHSWRGKVGLEDVSGQLVVRGVLAALRQEVSKLEAALSLTEASLTTERIAE